jgi:hypothetical protein
MTIKKPNHKSHIKGKGINKFMGYIDFKEFEDNRLKEWLKKYKKTK